MNNFTEKLKTDLVHEIFPPQAAYLAGVVC
jgi:hypothetical protein